jgi:hypothetical protein
VRQGTALLLVGLLLACGGKSAPPSGPPEDEVFGRLMHSAHRALELEQPASAARLYARALTRARERDDAAAIDDAAFGQATAALAHGDAVGAQTVAAGARRELARRARPASAGLLLAEATALHRLGKLQEADMLAAAVVARGVEDPAAASRATFLRGLVAATRRDLHGVLAARAALGDPGAPAFQADAAELEALAAQLRGDAHTAQLRATAARAARQLALDYRGLSRALALEGHAVGQLGNPGAAADLLLRAGRGAAERGEILDARRWLMEAEAQAIQGGVRSVAAEARRTAAALPRMAR